MALNIKDDSVHEAVKRITLITGESQAQAVATAVRERLARLEKDELAARLLAIGHKSASRMSADAKPKSDKRDPSLIVTLHGAGMSCDEHIAQLAGMLAPLEPSFFVSPDALDDCGVRPTNAEWSRFLGACDLVRSVHAESA